MSRYKSSAVSLALAILYSLTSSATDKPNVLIIMADDCTYNDLPLYGGKNAITPNLDHFARESLTFNSAYLSEAMCQPCRAELYSGLYPMSNGCAWNHSASRTGLQTMPQRMKALGYRVGIAGKVHVKPEAAFPFEYVAGCEKSCVRNPTREIDLTQTAEFMNRQADQPFCMVIALVEPHVPWVMGDASAYPPEKIKLPPNIADTPITRSDFGRYLAEITYMDAQVGQILDTLSESGHRDDTIVLFTSEQGSQFPGCKWTNWNTGVHTALVARWPGQIQPGTRTDALVQYADVLPTLVDAAGGDSKTMGFDGASFVDVLRGSADQHRNYVYHVHNNIPEGPAYPVRGISDGRYRYIRNLRPTEIYIEKHLMGRRGTGELNNPYWASWIWDSATSPATYRLVHRYMHRPAEELYDIGTDPYEMKNLAGAPSVEKIQQRLSQELDRWLEDQGDPGATQDTQEAIMAARKGKHLYGN